ncbi:peroxiredoxin [uncultured Roseobacter sp.]|uniref:peroxiredoxin n=1 Tax=uncultured Roseobacter sp. TaxID=114847 RepID=UPI00262AAC16|nr:peroxiredoxin [uncultured Roseobacter sp.]
MGLLLNEIAPDFTAMSTEGEIRFHEWIEGSWCVFFSHPKDFTPVCTTELGSVAQKKDEFDKRGVKVVGLSIDPVEAHRSYAADIAKAMGMAPNYPLVEDPELKIAKFYGMLPADANGAASDRTAMDNATARTLFIIGPDKRIKLMVVYPMTTGRNFDEILRVIDSLMLTANHSVSTPANWKQGEDVIIMPSVADDAARARFPGGWKAPLPYLRIVPQPN